MIVFRLRKRAWWFKRTLSAPSPGCFLDDPHSTVRRYKSLSDRVGKDIFVEGHKPDPYYTAAFTLYGLEYLFRNQKIESRYKIARFQILLAFRILANPSQVPQYNSNQMEKYCKPIIEALADPVKSIDLFGAAIGAIDAVAGGKLDRDSVHTLTFTDALIKHCKALAAPVRAAE